VPTTSKRTSGGKGVEKCQLRPNTQDGGLASFWRVGTGGNGIKCQLRPNKWREGCRKVPTMSEQAKQFGKVFLASRDWREWDKVPTTSKQKG